MESDPFLEAWGWGIAWKGAEHQARWLATLDPHLAAAAPLNAQRLAWALGQSVALREEAIAHAEALHAALKNPHLAQGMEALRWARRGPKPWRRYWLRRALRQAGLVQEEHENLRATAQQLAGWSRALATAAQALEAELARPWPVLPSELTAGRDRLEKQAQAVLTSLGQVRGHVEDQEAGCRRLEAKAQHLGALALSDVEGDTDPLQSPWLAKAREQALNALPSGLPGARE